MSISKELFLVTLNNKFETSSSFIFSNIVDFYSVITECLPSKPVVNLLKDYYVNLNIN